MCVLNDNQDNNCLLTHCTLLLSLKTLVHRKKEDTLVEYTLLSNLDVCGDHYVVISRERMIMARL